MFKYSISETYPIPKPPTFYDSPLNAVGVDLGTTRSCTAVFKNNKIDVIAIDNSDRPLPSYIGYEEGKPICGSVVARRMPTFSQHAVFDIKRIIGKSYESIVIDPFWPFKVIKGNNQNVKIKTLDSAKTEIFLSPEEVSAVLLKHMKIKAEENKNSKLTEAVITVPIAFNQNQIDATLEAAALAGWETVHILPEPIAACFTYASENEIPKNSNILLFDFGGGTLDICIVRIENEQLRILKSSGDLFLGGRNFDTLIMNHFMLILKEIHKIDIRNNNYKKYKLMLKCQEIKHDLEAVQEILLDVGDFAPEIDANTPFNREQFKELSYEILVRLEAKIRETLDSINFAPHQINYVLQVGGGCRMAMIKELLKSIFPNSQHRSTVDPDWAVAYGAALYCCYKMTQDVTSHDEVFRHLPEPRDKITQEYIKKYQEDVPPKATNGIEKSKSKVSLIKEKFENISNKTKHAKTYNSTFSNTYTPPEVTQNAYIIDRIPKVECVGWDCCAGAIRIANVDTQNRPEPKMITNQTAITNMTVPQIFFDVPLLTPPAHTVMDAFRCQPTKSPYFFCVPRINDKYVIPSFRRLMKNNPRIEDLVENGIPPESQTYTHQQIMETIIQEMSKAFNVRNVTQKEAHICVPDAASLNHIQKLRQAFIEVFSKRQKAKDIPKPENPKLSDPPPALKGEVPLTKSNIFFIQRTAAAIQMYFHRRSGAKVYDHNREQFHRENRVVPHEKDQSILPRTVVVIAFGAGHFSSAIYKQQTFERYGIRHIFNQSDDDLGGEDLCYRLCEYVGTHLKLDEQGKEALKNPRLKKLLRNTMDQAKIDLSGFTPATVDVEVGDDRMITLEISREDFEEKIAKKEFDKIEKYFKKLKEKTEGHDVTDILLVQGSTKNKKILNLVEEYFQDVPIVKCLNTDECIVMGTALKGALRNGIHRTAFAEVEDVAMHSETVEIDGIQLCLRDSLPENLKILYQNPLLTEKYESVQNSREHWIEPLGGHKLKYNGHEISKAGEKFTWKQDVACDPCVMAKNQSIQEEMTKKYAYW